MSMSKKNFITLADMIREHNQKCEAPAYFTYSQLLAIADFCKSQNPNFMRERWLDYIAGNCGKNGGAIK
jgi:hypothetical protein